MPRPITMKQEKFAREYVSNQGNASAAYRAAYETQNQSATSVTRNAHAVSRNANVASMITSLRSEALEANGVSPEKVIAMLQEDRAQAKGLPSPQLGVAVRVDELLGRTAGMFGDRLEVEVSIRALVAHLDGLDVGDVAILLERQSSWPV
jgi:phage terminase small subunit